MDTCTDVQTMDELMTDTQQVRYLRGITIMIFVGELGPPRKSPNQVLMG